MTIAELKEKNITELTKIARSLDLPGASGLRKQDLIFKILQAQSEKEGHIFAEGVLEILPDCFFFQAEDGIRYLYVTGVQTCALPISGCDRLSRIAARLTLASRSKASSA